MEIDQGNDQPVCDSVMIENKENGRNGITLYPLPSKRIKLVDESGLEVIEEEFNQDEVFQRAVQTLESSINLKDFFIGTEGRDECGNSKNLGSADQIDESCVSNEEEFLDPRIHYRSVVAELQAGNAELNQLINVIDLMRGKQFLEEAYCAREDIIPKSRDLSLMMSMTFQQMNQACLTLQKGVESLRESVHQERGFFSDISQLIGHWRLTLPSHGNIPKKIRAGEQLAVDCSYVLSSLESLKETSFCEIRRIENGHVLLAKPDDFISKTISVSLSSSSGLSGSYTLKGSCLPPLTPDILNASTEESLQKLKNYNENLLRSVQQSLVSQEIFEQLMLEALDIDNRRSEMSSNSSNGPSIRARELHILDDEIGIKINDDYTLNIQLHSVSLHPQTINKLERNTTDDENSQMFITSLCRNLVLFLQSEYGRVYSKNDNSIQLSCFHEKNEIEEIKNGLKQLITIASHSLLRQEVSNRIHQLSNTLCCQSSKSWITKFQSDSIIQLVGDTSRGINIKLRWKDSKKAYITAFDLSIGKSFSTEVIIKGSQIKFSPRSISKWGALSPDPFTCDSIQEFMTHVRFLISSQLTESLYLEVKAMHGPLALIDVDHLSLKILSSTEWNGDFIGEGSLNDHPISKYIVISPECTTDGKIHVQCDVYQMNPGILSEYIERGSKRINNPNNYSIHWKNLPGDSDIFKLHFLLHHLKMLPNSLIKIKKK